MPRGANIESCRGRYFVCRCPPPNDAPLPLDAPVLQALLDIIPGTLHVKDRDLRYCLVNRYYVERWNLRAEDVIGKRSSEIFGDEHDIAVEARDRQVLETGAALPFYEVEYATGDGRSIALWATKIPIFDSEGVASHVLTLALDITPLKRAERALNESELLEEMLSLGGYRVQTATSAERAMEMLRDDAFDAVLSDMRMPGMSGIEFYQGVAATHPALARRFAFISGEMMSASTSSFLQGSGVRHLEKPFSPQAVLSLVRSLLE